MKYLSTVACLICFIACNSSDNQKQTGIHYPSTTKDTSVKDTYFGKEIADPYRWLENDTSAETSAWVKVENDITQGYLATIPFRNAIKNRYKSLYNYEKYSSPFKEGNYTYYFKNSGLQNHNVLYREAEGKEPEVFLDPNAFSKDGTVALSEIRFSKDGSRAAYNISEGGSDWQKLLVIDATTKQIIDDTLLLKFSAASWKGNEGFYYSTYDTIKGGSRLSGITENHKLYYHKIGTPQSRDQLVFGSDNTPLRYVWGSVSEDEKWLFISGSTETYGNNLYMINLGIPGSKLIAVVADMNNQHGVVYSDDSFLYILTDKDAPTGKLIRTPVINPAIENWQTIIAPKPEVLDVSAAGGSLFCNYMKDALSSVSQYDTAGKMIREIALPGKGTAYGFSGKKTEKETYYNFTSYIHPSTIFRVDIETGKSSIYKKPGVQFNSGDYESNQVFYTSKDGTKIPMMITYKKGLKLNGKNPCLLYGYGGFGASITPYFSTSQIILLENGGVYAVANLRGGGEYGKEWHDQGIKTKKQNVFDDFIAAAQYLVDNKYTSRNMLAIEGGSNGGLLVGACITQQPDMCRVAIADVGVLDMLRYHKFTAGAGWAYDYGTSQDSKEMFEYLLGYSPLHNVRDTGYPATLISTADHDDRVVPAHSFKFAATLQEKNKSDNPVLIRIQTNAGHGSVNTEQIIEYVTDKWSFMFYNMGIKPGY
ncbi:MAG: S9 family peptidase [Chitinophagaceae bacterium]|nr:S9 family peptidase [Chitinophagaceae bacterium]